MTDEKNMDIPKLRPSELMLKIKEVVNTMTEEQKTVMYALVAMALNEASKKESDE